MASEDLLSQHLKDFFVLFKPKDVASGNFYQAKMLRNNKFTLITADSNGHGVPGAIMSILNLSCSDKVINRGITIPDLILNETRKLIINSLKNDGIAECGKDGMDARILSFDFINIELQCAAANNSVWIVRNKELIEIKADRFPLGRHDRDTHPFTKHRIDLKKGDMIYSFTDGFTDQFGRPIVKNSSIRSFKKYFCLYPNLSAQEQKESLYYIFEKWRGNLEQVDDVTIIGVRV